MTDKKPNHSINTDPGTMHPDTFFVREDQPQALNLINDLCALLSGRDIGYCHWKSNAAIDRSASGLNDLDLLIRAEDTQKFNEIIAALGFKQSQSSTDFLTPGVHNYYGLDCPSGKIVNVHAHFQLILGHDLSKNYHLPVEEAYIRSAKQELLFKIPLPEYELIVFVIRMVIKHFTWDTVLLNQGRLSKSEKTELEFLIRRISEAKLSAILNETFQFVDESVFQACLKMLTTNEVMMAKLRKAARLIKCLEPYSRIPNFTDALLKIWRRFYWPLQIRVFQKDFRKRMANGGLLVAIVGGDGAGKTTMIKEITEWLGKDFSIRKYHMGKPNWSLTTILVRGLLKIGTLLRLYPFQRSEIQYTHDPDLLVFPGYPWLIREVCTARDRYLTYKSARRYSSAGSIAILDRFPLQQIELMDGAQVARMTTQINRNRFILKFMAIEEQYYRKILHPDLLVVLRVDPQIAVQRKKGESDYTIRPRSSEIWEMNWDEIGANVVDAGQSKESVLSEVKELIWSRL